MSAPQTRPAANSVAPNAGATAEPLLEVRDLKTYFSTDRGTARAVDGVSFSIAAGSTLGLVGESGCGKSVTALSILRLIPSPPGKIVGGSIGFDGKELLALSEQEIRHIRGNDISMIFQEPMTSLNPVFKLGDQIMEAILVHERVSKAEARNRTIEMLKRVKIPYAETLLDQYPHQISGGMRQRVMIAMALVCRPKMVIADEPTTALDVTIQAQILELLRELQEEFGMSILIITHDLGIVSDLADAVAVMYAGQIVEYASTPDLFTSPKHPYTLGLFQSRPQLGRKKARLDVIPGTVPSPLNFPPGCRFHPRCAYVAEECRVTPVTLALVAERHSSRCLRVQKREIELSKT
ncbi:MAG: ABC transporter ATP-binding protein [Acidobacteria bacterium]|nr:ABC transporter ATP-binding protein [Acidobacteriota bacterium]